MDSEGHCAKNVVVSRESAAGLTRPSEILDSQVNVLQVEEDLEHEVVEGEVSEVAKAICLTADQEESLHREHGQVESQRCGGVFHQSLNDAVHDHESLDQQVGACCHVLELSSLKDWSLVHVSAEEGRKENDESD